MQKLHRFHCASVISMATLAVTSRVMGSAGVTLPLNQYQAGTEAVNNTLVTNGNFEQPVSPGADPVGWTATNSGGLTPAMSVGAPDPAHLPTPAGVVGTQVAKAGISNINANDQYEQSVTFAPNTEYVLSGYMWDFGLQTSGNFGDFIGTELVSNTDLSVTAGLFIEPNLKTGGTGTGAGGAFVYKTFNSSMFPEGASLQLRSDPQQSVAGGRPAIMGQWDNIAITPLTEFRCQVWNATTSGNWSDTTKWQNGPANVATAIATFQNQPGAITVNVESAKTVGTISFDSVGSYTISGSNITLQQEENPFAVNITVTRGSHTISAPLIVGETDGFASPTQQNRLMRVDVAATSALTISNNITSSGAKKYNFEKLGAGTLDVKAIRAKDVTITAGTLALIAANAPDPVIRAETLTIGATAKLNLRRGLAVVDYAAEGPSPLAALLARTVAGDILASSPNNNLVVAVAEASSLGTNVFGESVDATSVVLVSTLKGDANIDRHVNFTDLIPLAQNYGATSGAIYAQGDSNYDAKIDFADLVALAQNYEGAFLTGSFDGDWALAQSFVPEPTSLLIAAAPVTLLRRRR
jgi:hypothetical protein